MPITGARRAVMFMTEVAAVRGVQEAGAELDAGNSTRRQLHVIATGAGYYGAAALGTSSVSRGDNNARDSRYPEHRARVRAAVAQKRLPRVVIVVVV